MSDSKEHRHPNYVKIWMWLMVLLVISIVGPMLGITWILIITAFGVALVKALMVAAYFMHLNVEKRYIWYLLLTCLLFLLVLFTFTAPDILNHEGANWSHEKPVPEKTTPTEEPSH